MKNKILCTKCACWVDCSKPNNIYGFCLKQDLFTYTRVTAHENCLDYVDGQPLTEKEYESYNKGN